MGSLEAENVAKRVEFLGAAAIAVLLDNCPDTTINGPNFLQITIDFVEEKKTVFFLVLGT